MIKKVAIVTIGLLLNLLIVKAEGAIPSGIITSLGNGNAAELAQYFNTTIELTIDNNEQICSKVQAEIIIRDFFKSNHVTSCKVLHQSGSTTKYSIIQLKTITSDYRVTLLLKPTNDKYFIHQLRID